MIIIRQASENADSLGFFLSARGHWSQFATSAAEGLQLVQMTEDQVVWIDMALPDMNGYELACRIRALPSMSNCTLVALVERGQGKDEACLHAAGFAHWLHRPVELGEVQKLLEILDPEQEALHRS